MTVRQQNKTLDAYGMLPPPVKWWFEMSAHFMRQNPGLDVGIAQTTQVFAQNMIIGMFSPFALLAQFSKGSDFGAD